MAAPFLSTKRKGSWHCDLCDVSVTCQAHMATHVSGKKHRSKEDQSMNEDRTWCGLCKVRLTSSALAAVHYSGKKHKAKEAEKSAEKLDLWCGVCNLKCNGWATMRLHCEGRKHRNRVKENNADDPFDEMRKKEEDNGNGGESFEEKGMETSGGESAGDAVEGKGKQAEGSGKADESFAEMGEKEVENVNGSGPVEEKKRMEVLGNESPFGGKGKEAEGSGNGDDPFEKMGKGAEENRNGSDPVEENGIEAPGSENGGDGNEAAAVSTSRLDGHVLDAAPTFQSETNAVLGSHPCDAGSDPVGKMHEEAEGSGSEPQGRLKEFLCLFCKVKYSSMNELMEHRRSEEHKARV